MFSRFKKSSDDVAVAEEEAENLHQRAFEEDKELRKLFRKLDQKAELQQATVGWSFFVIFLAYPSVTNKIFAFFYCYNIDENTAFLMADYSVSCHTITYYLHTVILTCLMMLIPVGIPVYFWKLVSKNDEFCIKNEKLCNKITNTKTRNFELKMMNFAGKRRLPGHPAE